ncbi:MAG: ABC transporter permease [Chryseolinea sp.]
MKNRPPRLARRIFKLLSGSADIDDLLGDLDEWFYHHVRTHSLLRAQLFYWKSVLSLSFSYALTKRKRDVRISPYSSVFTIDIFGNYIKVAWRNLYQHKYFSFLNAFGLAIGMSVSLLFISLYSFVSTYDNFHVNKDRIYTITSKQQRDVEELEYSTAPHLLADKILAEFGGVNKVVRIVKAYESTVKTEKEDLPAKAYYVDPEFMSVFSFDMIQGNPNVLAAARGAILTRSLAIKLFDSMDVIGETIELLDGRTFQIGGIMEDHPNNSHLSFEMLLSYSTISESKLRVEDQWSNYPKQYIYVLLKDGAISGDLQNYIDGIAARTYSNLPVKVTFSIQHLESIVMGRDLRSAIGVKWEASGFLLFGIFCSLILLPACFNYANISIARALRRSKEIGLRKTMGGVSKQIFFQFITETLLITVVSLGGALLIFILIRAEFKSILVAGSSLDLSLTWRMVGMFFMFAITTGLAAGVFPALHFARLNPIQALKSKINTHGSSMRVRKVLTICQFALSFGFILSLIVFSRQYRYSVNFDFGFEHSNTVAVHLQDVDPDRFKMAFTQLAAVKSVAFSSGLLGVHSSFTWVRTGANDSIEVAQLFADPNFISTMNLQFLAGENFRNEGWQGERHIVVNEEFLKANNIDTPIDALGKIYRVDGKDLEIIGVLKNFHYMPLQYPVGKFFFRMKPSEFAYANMRVTSMDAFDMFTQMENEWKRLPTEKKFLGKYFDDELDEAYSTYKVLLKIVGFLGVLAITISLLGMLGMVVYTSETRTKEVGIRKVLGATVTNVALLLSRDYVKMMAWAILFAAPITALIANRILSGIQYYSIELSVFDVIFSALILLLLGIMTIVFQTFKIATSNPANILRTE